MMQVVAADHECIRTMPVDITCLHGAQFAYSLASTPSALPRYLVLPPTVMQELPQAEMSVVFRYTMFCRHFDAPGRERLEYSDNVAQAELEELGRVTVALVLACSILSGLALMVLVSYVILRHTESR